MDLNQWCGQQRGRVRRLADALGVRSSVISDFKNGVRPIGMEDAVRIERAIGIQAEKLCPKHADLITFLRSKS